MPVLADEPVQTQHEDGVAWLVVLSGTWGYGHATGEFKIDRYGEPTPFPVVEQRDFAQGLHWVNQETVDFALRSRTPNLVVTEEKPTIYRRSTEGPFTLAHLRLPSERLALSQPEILTEAVELPEEIPYDFPCGICTRKFPSAGARDWHRDEDHDHDQAQIEEEDPVIEVEPALTDA